MQHRLDHFDLALAQMHNSPDVRNWPVGVTITGIHLRPGTDTGGFSFEFAPRNRWPNYEPPTWDQTGGEGLQYTVWLGVLIGGVWHLAGIIQMWRSKLATGAPLPSDYRSWIYDTRWGAMNDVTLKAGDTIALMLTAGNARKGSAGPEPDITTVAERSQVVTLRLPVDGVAGDWVFNVNIDETPAPPPPPPPPAGDATSTPGVDLALVLGALADVRAAVIDTHGAQLDAIAQARDQILEAIATAAQSAPAPAPTAFPVYEGTLQVFGARIPLRLSPRPEST